MKKGFIILAFIGSITTAFAQIQEITDDIKVYLKDKIENIPGEDTDVFQEVSTAQFETFKSAIGEVANHEFEDLL